MREWKSRIEATIATSALVRERTRFALHELSGRRSVGIYRPWGSDLRVCVRHNFPSPGKGSLDNFPLHEVFGERCYQPPAAVHAAVKERGSDARIVDLGGHLGYFGVFALSEYPEARVLAFEPEPNHARLLRSCIEVNGLHAQWELIEACAHTEDGTLSFAAARSVASHLADLSGEQENVIEVAARDVFPHLTDTDFLKVDIEGGEWRLLFDERFAAVLPRAVVLEYHSGGCPGDNPKKAARERFTELGYRVEVPPGDTNPDEAPFWGRGLLWAWRL